MPKVIWLLLMTMSLIAGCRSTTAPGDTACYWVKPITTTAAERKAMTRETKIQIAAHNDLYARICGDGLTKEK